MQHGLLLLHAVAASSALTVRESGERVVYNALCRRYERAAPIVRRGGLASDEVAIFVSVASLPRYCHVRLDWAASFPSAYAVVGGNGTHELAHVQSECTLLDAQRAPAARKGVKGPHRWRMMRCGPEGVAPVLLAMPCRGVARCCLENAAARAFLDRAATTFRKARWSVFVTADDLYVRAASLLAPLSLLDPATPRNVFVPEEEASTSGEADAIGGAAPCVSGASLLERPHAVSGLSRKALEASAATVQADGFARQCGALDVADAASGFAAFSWSLGLAWTALPPVVTPNIGKTRGATEVQLVERLKQQNYSARFVFRRAAPAVAPLLRQLDDDAGLCVESHPACAKPGKPWAPVGSPCVDAVVEAGACAPATACPRRVVALRRPP